MKGRRVDGKDAFEFEPGDYGRGADGLWYAMPPGDADLLANLSRHEVVEHADGTITVKPSIAVERRAGQKWHGYLELGVWRKEP